MATDDLEDMKNLADAHAALSRIPAHGRRRSAALYYLADRVATEIKHELDMAQVEASVKIADAALKRATPPTEEVK